MASIPPLPGVSSAPTTHRHQKSSSVATQPSHSQGLRQNNSHLRTSSSTNPPGGPSASVSSGSRHRTSTARPPLAPLRIASTALVNSRASLSGKHLITIGDGAVIHPYVRIISNAGEVVIGKGCIIEERATVGYSSVNSSDIARKASMHSNPSSAGTEVAANNGSQLDGKSKKVVLGDGVTVGPGAVIEAESIGEMSVIEGAAVVASGSVLGKFCKVGPALTVAPNSNIQDFTILYGPGPPPAVPLECLLPSSLNTLPLLPSRPQSATVPFSFPFSNTPLHTPSQSIDSKNLSLQTPLLTPGRTQGSRQGTGGGAVASNIRFPVPPPKRRIDFSSRDNEVVRQQRRVAHERHLGVLRKLLAGTGAQSGGASGSTPSSVAASSTASAAASASASAHASASASLAAAPGGGGPGSAFKPASTSASTSGSPSPAITASPLPGLPQS